MLGLKEIPLETTLPAHTRRRVWSCPELTSHSLLVLTFERLHLAPAMGVPKPELLAAAETRADLDAVLGPLAIVIDLVTIRRLSLDLVTNSLTVEYASSGPGKSAVRITFATAEAADACFTKIWRRLGDGYRLAQYQRDTWQTIRAPLLALALVLFVTAALSALASLHEDRALASPHADAVAATVSAGSSRGSLLDWLNWKVVCGLGGAAAAGSQVWLYRRLTTPPVALDLVKV